MHDHLIRAIARGANLRVCCTLTTSLVEESARRHRLSPAATCAVGRALTSEQVPSALSCEVVLRPDGHVQAAAGVLVQAMPGGDPDSVREFQEALRSGRLYDLLQSGEWTAAALASAVYSAEPLEVVGEE